MDPACRLFSLTKAGQTCRFTYSGRGGSWKMPGPAWSSSCAPTTISTTAASPA